MILDDLFEGGMSNLDIEYQDWKNMSPVAFLSRYKITKDEWYAKHQSLVPAEGSVQEGKSARERWNKASAEREKKHNEIEARRQAVAKQGKTDVPGAVKRLEKALGEQTQELSIGDPVIIQGTEYNGKTGEIGEFSPSGKFVVVNLYNYGPQAFNLANVKYNEYADNEEQFDEEKVRLDPKCWSGKKIGNPKTKLKGGVRVNNCVPVEEQQLDELSFLGSECTKDCSGHRAGYDWSKQRGGADGNSPWSPSFNKGAALAKAGK